MRSKGLVGVLLLAVLGITGCGSSGKHRTSTRSGGGTTTIPSAPNATYSANLSGKDGGVHGGAARAVIKLHGKTGQACWKFTGLTRVSKPTFAYVWRGGAGTHGVVVFPLSTSKQFELTGCSPAAIDQIRAVEHDPSGFYATIDNKAYPVGAVRGQL